MGENGMLLLHPAMTCLNFWQVTSTIQGFPLVQWKLCGMGKEILK